MGNNDDAKQAELLRLIVRDLSDDMRGKLLAEIQRQESERKPAVKSGGQATGKTQRARIR